MSVKMIWENNEPNNTSAYLHTDKLLSLDNVSELHSRKSDEEVLGAALVKRLYEIHGVQEARINRYKVRIERTRMVEWNQICPDVEKAVEDYVSYLDRV